MKKAFAAVLLALSISCVESNVEKVPQMPENNPQFVLERSTTVKGSIILVVRDKVTGNRIYLSNMPSLHVVQPCAAK